MFILRPNKKPSMQRGWKTRLICSLDSLARLLPGPGQGLAKTGFFREELLAKGWPKVVQGLVKDFY